MPGKLCTVVTTILLLGSILTFAPPAAADDGGPVADEPWSAIPEETVGTLAAEVAADCIYIHRPGASACFQRQGDTVWILDTETGGGTARAYWSLWLRDADGNWRFRRSGNCWSTGTPQWRKCKYEFYEDSTYPNAFGGQGAGIRLYPVVGDTWSGYRWIRNNA